MMKFCTAINCMDGRIQASVVKYMHERFNAKYVDMITEAGICCVLPENKDKCIVDSVLKKLKISVDRDSQGIGVVGHFDCKGNPVSKEIQIGQINETIDILKKKYSDINIIGLWVDEEGIVSEVQY